MLKKTIKYTDYNGTERIEDFYFNLNQTDVLELEAKTPGGLENYLTRIRNAVDISEIYDFLMTLIKKSYGVKSDDGRTIKKTDEIFDNFKSSAAFDPFIMEFVENPASFADFIAGIYPAMDAEAKKELERRKEELKKEIEAIKQGDA